MNEHIDIWLVGNTGLRNPNRIQDGFKKAIDNAINGTTQIKRHCTENGHHNPGKGNNDKAFSAVNSFILRCEMLHGCSDDQKQYDGNQKSP